MHHISSVTKGVAHRSADSKDRPNPSIEDISDPGKVGPGIWYVFFEQAISSKTKEEQKEFISLMKNIIDRMRCPVCKEHALKYLAENPPDKYLNITLPGGENIGMFKYVWKFKKAVNKRLGKPEMDWDTAYGIYSKPESVCTEVCSGKSSIPEPKVPILLNPPSKNVIPAGVSLKPLFHISSVFGPDSAIARV